MNDNELIYLYCVEKNKVAWVYLYRYYEIIAIKLIKVVIKKFFAAPLEINDLKAIFYFGLIEIIFSFQESKNKAFKNFFYDKFKWILFGYFKKFTTNNHKIINYALKYEDYFFQESDDYQIFTYEDLIATSQLTKYEKEILNFKLKGYNNCEIMEKLNINYKQVDNALTRAKIKLKNNYKNYL